MRKMVSLILVGAGMVLATTAQAFSFPPFKPLTREVVNQVGVPPGGYGAARVACPTGAVLTGGGFGLDAYLHQFIYGTSASGIYWEADAVNDSNTNELLNSYAMCLYFTSGSTQQMYSQTSVPANSIVQATVNCPAGSIVTGGGFAGNPSLVVYNSSKSGNGWTAYAKSISNSSQLFNAYAMCLSGTSGSSQQVVGMGSIPTGDIGQVTVACPAGSIVTGGGYATHPGVWVYNSSKDFNGWSVAAKTLSSGGIEEAYQRIDVYAICTTFP